MYTLCLDMTRAHCLIIGMGKVGTRKLTTLLAASPASVLVLDIGALSADAKRVCDDPCVRYEARSFVDEDVQTCFFVIAATDDALLNLRIARLCQKQNILCNCITAPHEGNAFVPAIVERHGISCSITTQGASPALAKVLRQELAVWLEEKASPLPVCMARLRPHILHAFQDDGILRQSIFQSLVESKLALYLQSGDRTLCVALLQAELPSSLHSIIDEVLYDLV